MTRFVYADNAATTPVSREVIDAMSVCFENAWGNPSSQHGKGYEAKTLVDGARERIARVFNCNSSELYFTASGTESDNWAIKGTAEQMAKKGKKHIIIFLVGCTFILGTCATMAITNKQIAIAALAGAICILWYILVNFLTLISTKR